MATATSDNDTRLPGLPRYIRINTLKTSRSEAAKSLTATGHVPEQQSTYRAARKGDAPAESSNRSYVPDAHVPDLLVFKPKGQSDISRIPLVALLAQDKVGRTSRSAGKILLRVEGIRILLPELVVVTIE